MQTIIQSYNNGNIRVVLSEDGTKTREVIDRRLGSFVEFPESCDLKITNYCDLSDFCGFCHEQSDKSGTHADLDKIIRLWEGHQPGTEIAIGGGNPLSHPDLGRFLEVMSMRGFVCNLTVNSAHLQRVQRDNIGMLREWQTRGVLKGLGVSYRGMTPWAALPKHLDWRNAVCHMILGVDTMMDLYAVCDWYRSVGARPKILLLGYKKFGNGTTYFSERTAANLERWQTDIATVLRSGGRTIAFDNLALKQLHLRKRLSPRAWMELYQGRDGAHTFYVDAVKMEAAKTSTSTERRPITESHTVRSLFEEVRFV
jgi:hypothetical protein